MAKIKLVVLDVAGTTAEDDGLVIKAFTNAMEPFGLTNDELVVMTEYVKATMGQRKIDVFLHLCNGDADLADAAHERFVTSYTDLVAMGELHEFAGVSDFFKELKSKGIGVGISSGFPRSILDVIINVLKWQEIIDVSVAASEVAQGRPAPDMIFRAMEIYNAQKGLDLHPSDVAVAGDTQSDMAAGASAGAAVILGVTSGTHSEDELWDAGATDVATSVKQLLVLLN